MGIDFVGELPESGSSKYDWNTIIRSLKSRPQEWGLVTTRSGDDAKNPGSAGRTRARITEGQIPGVEPGEFEAVTRGRRIYARYMGDPDS